MRRLLSLVVALVLVMGTVSVFAVSADWSGNYYVKYRSSSVEVGTADPAYTTYMWQKLELYPSFTLSDNVKISAGFFHQQFWGVGRLVGINSSDFITVDPGGYAGLEDANPLNQTVNKANTTLGVSAAWATLTFMEGKLGIDIGRRRNAEWGTGAFFGGPFAPDRIFITYKTPGMGGVMIPYFIYEKRMSNSITDPDQNADQFLAGLIYLAPGKTLFGLTVTYLPTGKAFPRHNAGVTLTDGALFAADLYVDHKIKTGFGSVKPIFEVVYAAGKIADKDSHSFGALPAYAADFHADVLNFLLKAEISVDKMVTVVPEVVFQVAPKKGTANERYLNFWGVNEYAGTLYTVGNIFNGFTGGNGLLKDVEVPSTMYGKLDIQLDLLDEMVKGLGANVYFIYAMPLGKVKTSAGDFADSDKNTVLELGLGVSYAIDQATTASFDFAYAQTGKGTMTAATVGGFSHNLNQDAKYIYFGADLTVKF